MSRPRVHLAISAGLSAVQYLRTRRALPAVAPLISGFLIDADHLLDRQPSAPASGGGSDKVRLALHGWELLGLVAAVEARWTGRQTGFGLVLGMLAHLVTDQLVNQVQHPLTYFLTFRAIRRFDPQLFGGEAGTHKWRRMSLRDVWRWL